ncbi:hypothetical protein SEUCBS140593_002065 [Sporothrix eucalyptigena]|uniref:Major facilitator superfamily (MFS) profile domain-containing protein n=1 Tax=Sporothrix eucalyptigena TaxID=1812306 RepID=A0ABP0B3J8_9PEZI
MKASQTAAEKALHDQTNILPRSKLIVALITLSLTLGITMMDQNGISVTLPTIGKDLNAQNTVSWAGTSSLIANTTFQMLYGRMSDIFGRKVVFISATLILLVADLLCGLSQNAPMFYVFRGVAGIAGGGITNLAMIIVSDVVTLEQRGFYQGVLGESAAKIDCAGVLSSSIAVIFLLIPISGGGSYFEWTSPMVISMLVIGVCAFVFFVVVEWKIARLPMMPGQYLSRRKRYGEVLWFGFGMWTIGSGLMLLLNRETHVATIVGFLVLIGTGVGCSFQPTLVALQANSPKARRAVVISSRNFFRCCGGAFGLAASAAVLQAALRANLPAEYRYLANNTYSLPKAQGPDFDAVLDAYMAASRAVFMLQLPLVALCLFGCIFVKDHGLEPMEDKVAAEAAAAELSNPELPSRSQIEDDEKALGGGSLLVREVGEQPREQVTKIG